MISLSTDPLVQTWLDKSSNNQVLLRDPFSIDLLEDTWCDPVEWKQVRSRQCNRFSALNQIDLDIITSHLWYELRKSEKNSPSGYFTVYVETFTLQVSPSGIYSQLAHWVAEAWIKFMLYNPDSFLDLALDEQHALAAYLQWHTGSLQALIRRLRYNEVISTNHDNEQKRMEFELFLEKLSGEDNFAAENFTPNEDQLLEWLQIRPPWLDMTVLILVHQDRPKPEWLKELGTYQRIFLKRGVIIKEFGLDWPEGTEVTLLEWNQDCLLSMLSLRIQRATYKPPTYRLETFTNLFVRRAFRDRLDADNTLAGCAQNSLSRLLELGEAVLINHARNHPASPELFTDDLEQATSS